MAEAPFPRQQLFILALCRICEPIAFMSIFPYVYYMVASFKVTADEHQIAIYAGLVTSSFAFAEFSTGVLWGRISDRVGRKPILLTGLAGTGLSMLVFGFAPSLPVALLARALGGLLNGNIGVLQTTVAEVVKVEAHQARAFSIMPFVWCLGSIIGSGLGGTLAEPAKNYPTYVGPDSLFYKYPYLLPNLVCAAVVIFGLVVGILFLEETHEDKKERRDVGLEVGKWITGLLNPRRENGCLSAHLGCLEESELFLPEDGRAGELSVEGSAPVKLSSSKTSKFDDSYANVDDAPGQTPSVWQAFTAQMLLLIVGYGVLALHTISCEQLLPVLLSLTESDSAISLPFKFTGGFGLASKEIGFILSVQGVLQMIAQVFFFPWVTKKLGSLCTFRVVVTAYPILYFLVPYLTLLPHGFRMIGVYAILTWKVTAQSLAFPSMVIMIANSAPSKKVLGTINGAAASSASLCRAVGPTVSGLIQSKGLRMGYVGLPWWTSAGIAMSGAFISLWMRNGGAAEQQNTPLGNDDMEVGQGHYQPCLSCDDEVLNANPNEIVSEKKCVNRY